MRSKVLLTAVFMMLPYAVTAGEPGFTAHDSALSVSGNVDFSMGEIVKGMYKQVTYIHMDAVPVAHAWLGNPLARLNLTYRPNERVKGIFGFEGNILLNTFPQLYKTTDVTFLLIQYMGLRLHQAQGIVSLFRDESLSLDLSIGLMPYKYNPQVRNLGEFLFRSGTYPFFLSNDFNFPLARLTGIRLNVNCCVNEDFSMRFDQFVLTEREFRPFNDISIASVLGINFRRMVDIGGGVDFTRAIPGDSRFTTPEYGGENFDSPRNQIRYEISPGDTGCYTFKGVKLMAHATIDPLRMFRDDKGTRVSEILGENGGKIYGEIALIGFKNYPVTSGNPYGYKERSERMPWMAGINIPMWKIMDVCAFELEKYPAPYPNDPTYVLLGQPVPGLPLPVVPSGSSYDSRSYRIDRWYWSLYMKKEIVRHFNVIGQIAHDHLKWTTNAGMEQNYDFEDALVKPGEWAWRIAGAFDF